MTNIEPLHPDIVPDPVTPSEPITAQQVQKNIIADVSQEQVKPKQKPLKYRRIVNFGLFVIALLIFGYGFTNWLGHPDDVSGLFAFVGIFAIVVGAILFLLTSISAIYANKAAVKYEEQQNKLASMEVAELNQLQKRTKNKTIVLFVCSLLSFLLITIVGFIPDIKDVQVMVLTTFCVLGGIFFLIVTIKFLKEATKINRIIKNNTPKTVSE